MTTRLFWGNYSSPLTFAYENFMYDVVAHTCSQKNMNKQWYNNLAPDLKPFFMVSISVKSKLICVMSCYVDFVRHIIFFQFYYNYNTHITLNFKIYSGCGFCGSSLIYICLYFALMPFEKKSQNNTWRIN